MLYSAAFGRRIAGWPLLQKAVAFFFLSDPQLPRPSARPSRARRSSFAWYIGWRRRSGCPGSPRPRLGAYFGGLVANPQALGLDFLLPIYFLGLVMSFRKRPLWLPVVAVERRRFDHRLQDSSARHGTSSIGAIAGIAVAVIAPIKAAPPKPTRPTWEPNCEHDGLDHHRWRGR